MLALLLSPVPMVRGFGLLLVAGVAIALAGALHGGRCRDGASGAEAGRDATAAALRSAGAVQLAAAWRGAHELLLENPLTRLISARGARRLRAQPRRVLCVGLALAALGWGLDTQTSVETDITKLVPQSLGSLRGSTSSSARPGWAARST